jgi:hypothetical protein
MSADKTKFQRQDVTKTKHNQDLRVGLGYVVSVLETATTGQIIDGSDTYLSYVEQHISKIILPQAAKSGKQSKMFTVAPGFSRLVHYTSSKLRETMRI